MTVTRPLPKPTPLTAPFWENTREGKLVIQHCRSCGSHQFYPRPVCIKCTGDTLDWRECSGLGSIYTYTVNHRAAHPSMEHLLPYAVAVVELDEGVRMFANIVDVDPAELRIGARVFVVFETISDEITLPQFRLARE